ncbi:NADH-quinone oxidoreductase subunit N, partial [Amylibacter sp.]|nr:NADH-quinone oxidoreductase subunit N [Amylibacter sp.]
MISTDINIVLPEITLAVFSMAALMIAVYGGKDRLAGLMIWATSGIMGLLGLWLSFLEPGASSAFNSSFINDGYAR